MGAPSPDPCQLLAWQGGKVTGNTLVSAKCSQNLSHTIRLTYWRCLLRHGCTVDHRGLEDFAALSRLGGRVPLLLPGFRSLAV